MDPNAIVLTDDLIFGSRVTGAGRAGGMTVRSARSASGVLALSENQWPTCVIVDLANPGLCIADLVATLAKWPIRPRIVAYGSHVDVATLQAARAAGCDVVLPRSRFVEVLEESLPDWLAPPVDGMKP